MEDISETTYMQYVERDRQYSFRNVGFQVLDCRLPKLFFTISHLGLLPAVFECQSSLFSDYRHSLLDVHSPKNGLWYPTMNVSSPSFWADFLRSKNSFFSFLICFQASPHYLFLAINSVQGMYRIIVGRWDTAYWRRIIAITRDPTSAISTMIRRGQEELYRPVPLLNVDIDISSAPTLRGVPHFRIYLFESSIRYKYTYFLV